MKKLLAILALACSPIWALPLHVFLGGGGSAPAPAGPIDFVAAAGNNFSATRSPSVDYPTCVANDVLIAIFCADGTASYNGSPPLGWNFIDADDDGVVDQTGAVYWKLADNDDSGSSDPWTNITAANETGRVIVLAYRNCNTTTPINASNVSGRGSTTGQDTSSITPTVDNCMIVAAFVIDPGAFPRTFTWDATIVERIDQDTTPTGQNGTDAGIHVGDKLQTTAGAITLGGDFPAAENAVAIAIALAPL